MTHAALEAGLYFAVLTMLAVPLGRYAARVYEGEAWFAQRLLGSLERVVYWLAGVRVDEDMRWTRYALCLLAFNFAGMVGVYGIERLQGVLPLNPAGLGPVPPSVAVTTAVSFVTNTNWQVCSGETTMSHLTQMLALTVQNFLSAATGMAVAVALLRGFARRGTAGIGNFWVDITRGTLYILVPLSTVLALFLVSQGVVQTFEARAKVELIGSHVTGDSRLVEVQSLALGPVASQVAIKQLGTNGGGFFNANAAHPFENPTPLSNFAELVAILLIPAAFCFTFGVMVKSARHGWLLFLVMMLMLVPSWAICASAEQAGNPALTGLGLGRTASALQPGGNMEGKELRFGIVGSTLWATATTAASNGSVNAMLDSFTPVGGLVPMCLMQLGEVVFGGVGSGLYGMLMFVIVAVFIAGLMVGRTPEFLGKKLEAFEIQMASLAIILPATIVLVGTAIACTVPSGTASVANPGAHGFSEILYAFSSGANNNGSAFGGLNAGTFFYTTAISLCMLLGRYWVIVPALAIAGSLAGKSTVPVSSGTLPTASPLFALLLAGTVLLMGALSFIPALALGPIVEQLQRYW